MAFDFENPIRDEDTVAVSYTHLDVYKRQGNIHLIQKLLQLLACDTQFFKIHQHQMIVRTAGNNIYASFLKAGAKSLGILHHQTGIFFKFRLKGFLKADCLGCCLLYTSDQGDHLIVISNGIISKALPQVTV